MPSKFDLETGEVHNSMHEVHYFRYACHLINHLHCGLLTLFQSACGLQKYRQARCYAIYCVIFKHQRCSMLDTIAFMQNHI